MYISILIYLSLITNIFTFNIIWIDYSSNSNSIMVYLSALLGSIIINLSIAMMTFLQAMYQGEACRKSRYIILGAMMLAIVCSTLMILLEWFPLIGEVGASLIVAAAIVLIAALNFWAAAETGIHDDCSKARLYSIILGIILPLLGILVFLLTFV